MTLFNEYFLFLSGQALGLGIALYATRDKNNNSNNNKAV